MDIVKILSDLKGKVLDATHFELLQSAYELQNENITQLKENNEAIKETNGFLNEKIERLNSEKIDLQSTVEHLEAKLASIPAEGEVGLSATAIDILRKCIEQDITDFDLNRIIPQLSYSRLQTEAAIDELEEKDLIQLGSVGMDSGPNYYITPEGKKQALKLSNE